MTKREWLFGAEMSIKCEHSKVITRTYGRRSEMFAEVGKFVLYDGDTVWVVTTVKSPIITIVGRAKFSSQELTPIGAERTITLNRGYQHVA